MSQLVISLEAPLPKEGILGDQLSQSAETFLGVLGAAAGRRSGRQIGIGGTVQIPGIIANRFRELGRAGVNNSAQRLIVEAIQDETLFREVLMAPW